MRKLFVFCTMAGLFLSCSNPEEQQNSRDEEQDPSAVYYPVNNYIRQQVKDVDSTPYYLYRIRVTDDRRDSSAVGRPAFDTTISKQFLLPELEDKEFRKHFSESAFKDESTNSITLTYAPKNKDGVVQSVNVLLGKENQKVKWIFINTLESREDSTVIRRIGWKADKSCYLNISVTYPEKKERQEQLSFVWNDREEKE